MTSEKKKTIFIHVNNEVTSELISLKEVVINGVKYFHGLTTNLQEPIHLNQVVSTIALTNFKYIPPDEAKPELLLLNDKNEPLAAKTVVYISNSLIENSYLSHMKVPVVQSLLFKKSAHMNLEFSKPQYHGIKRDSVDRIDIGFIDAKGSRVHLNSSSLVYLTFSLRF